MGLSTGNWSELRGKINNIIWEKCLCLYSILKENKEKKRIKRQDNQIQCMKLDWTSEEIKSKILVGLLGKSGFLNKSEIGDWINFLRGEKIVLWTG